MTVKQVTVEIIEEDGATARFVCTDPVEIAIGNESMRPVGHSRVLYHVDQIVVRSASGFTRTETQP